MNKIAVVIPYYQRAAGILHRALKSIYEQDVDSETSIDIIVVDDASPQAASKEIEGLDLPKYVTIRVVRQQNAGPAAARNTGLTLVPPDATWIAFLDSDDEWRPNHIRTALKSLGNGVDLYFCDHKRDGFHDSNFSSIPYPLASEPFLSRKAMLSLTLHHMPCHLSTLVFRKEIAAGMRFDSRLRGAGEDMIFILQLTSSADCIAVSADINVACGKGVNIYFGNMDWNDPGHLFRMAEKVWAYTLLARMVNHIGMSSDDIENVQMTGKQLRDEFAYLWVRKAVLKKAFPGELFHLIRRDPRTLLWFPQSLGSVLMRKMLGTYRPLSGY